MILWWPRFCAVRDRTGCAYASPSLPLPRSAASHARSQRLAEAHDALAHAMCDSAAAAAALPHLRLALAALRAHYPEGSVVLAHEAAKAAGVAAAAGEDAFAGRLAKEALAAFESHYGPGFPRSRDPELLRAAAAGEE